MKKQHYGRTFVTSFQLFFLEKIMGKGVGYQQQRILDEVNYLAHFQSGVILDRSEMAAVTLLVSVLWEFNSSGPVEFPEAFDTTYYGILLHIQ